MENLNTPLHGSAHESVQGSNPRCDWTAIRSNPGQICHRCGAVSAPYSHISLSHSITVDSMMLHLCPILGQPEWGSGEQVTKRDQRGSFFSQPRSRAAQSLLNAACLFQSSMLASDGVQYVTHAALDFFRIRMNEVKYSIAQFDAMTEQITRGTLEQTRRDFYKYLPELRQGLEKIGIKFSSAHETSSEAVFLDGAHIECD